ncbi:unnamed protein product [Periconia digitata]|uniref:NDT80 domain-containing protein n=1 Tax=Periconia digitata TaxID=1303443 RepID=A0A9W4USZ9_9PLEO|nr:unnamed protein product [Periconia digitata]
MDGFDTITMSWGAPMSLPNVTGLPLDHLDQPSNYDAETFVGSEDQFAHHHLAHPPPIKRFSTQYDDPFSDVLSTYDQQSLHPDHAHNGGPQPESPSIERDNKLLSFSPYPVPYGLLSFAMQRVSISMSAQLHGMFFLAESPWAASGDVKAAPSELTCYRRNLFQITGTITLPRSLHYLLTEQGDQIPIIGQDLTISAAESLEGNPVKIISVPWKTPAANATATVDDKSEKEPPSFPLDLSTGQDMDPEYVSFPISWKRLQFRIATANNGRRKELQQHFVVRLKVTATLATGIKVPICEVQSGAIIVRGRSPRNFQSRKDMPISGGGGSVRKAHPPGPTRASTGETSQTPQTSAQSNSGVTKAMDSLQLPFEFNSNDPLLSPDFSLDWKMPPGPMTAIPPDAPSTVVAPVTPYAQSTPEISRNSVPQRASIAPVSLSLTDDEPKKPASPSEHLRKRATPVRPSSFSVGLIHSPDESADLLYEYFPLGLDDWMPPVDAVYRPHVVHHTNLPQDPKVLAVKNKSKRYFSDAW